MRSMISLIDKLRDFNLEEYIALPKIAVLGEQSSGKSSLLESICGLNFLPRGSGVVTRRPLELRMVRSSTDIPYFVFPKDFDNKQFNNQEEVRKIIEDLTNKVAGTDKFISEEPIICSVFSQNVPDLTLIDLPGVTRNPVGNQPKNIEEITKGLVRKYCQEPNTLILCVIPANIDISTSDSLKFAQELDIDGSRTLGVLTKIDLMDDGTDARNVLLNKEIPLKHGYVAVKGRSQKDVNVGVTVSDAIKRELDYFGTHPLYSTLPTELLGTRSLIDRTSKVLYRLIQSSLPRIQDEIIERKRKAKESLEALGEDFPETEEKKLELVFRLVRCFKENFDQEISGKFAQNINTGSIKETVIFQVTKLFSELFEDYIAKDFQITKDYSDDKINTAINIYQGESIIGFYSFDSFLELINPKLELLKHPVFHLLDESKNVLETRGLEIIDNVFKKFGKIAIEVKDTFQKHLNKVKSDTRRILETLMNCEEDYIFTNDPAMLDLSGLEPLKAKSSGSIMVAELRIRIDNYFNIIIKNLRDTIPKILGQFLIKRFNEELEVVILNALNAKCYCLEVFNENKTNTSNRQKLRNELGSLSKAETLLVNEFGMGFSLKNTKSVKSAQTVGEITDEELITELESTNEEFLKFATSISNKNVSRETPNVKVTPSILEKPNQKTPEQLSNIENKEISFAPRQTQVFTSQDKSERVVNKPIEQPSNPVNTSKIQTTYTDNISGKPSIPLTQSNPSVQWPIGKTYVSNPVNNDNSQKLNNRTTQNPFQDPRIGTVPQVQKIVNDPYNLDLNIPSQGSQSRPVVGKPIVSEDTNKPKTTRTNNLFGDNFK